MLPVAYSFSVFYRLWEYQVVGFQEAPREPLRATFADIRILTRVVAATGTLPFRWERASSGRGWRTVPASAAGTTRPAPPSPAVDTWRRRRQFPRRRGGPATARLRYPARCPVGAVPAATPAVPDVPSTLRHSRHIRTARQGTSAAPPHISVI